MPRLLIVEDEPALRRALSINLHARGYEVDTVSDGGSALRAAAANPPDLAIVDLGLPDMDGGDVIAGLRGWCTAPIIVLSARDAQASKVAALDAGADDYVTKPFGMDELVARVRASLRRADINTLPSGAVVETESFTLDLAAKRATHRGADVRLTPTEWHLVEMLVRHPGTLVPGSSLLAEVWGPGYEKETNYLRVYFAQVRRKLEDEPGSPRHFITEPGMGYRFDP
ncbi:response regulator [Propionicicella superfundia]|uniref:response regulator n=1 Tax=Propionicicella superfundia TaxID=348582 RepID=UPI000416E17D|nr:response regulator transcription factor [Propionicicella superfundia]